MRRECNVRSAPSNVIAIFFPRERVDNVAESNGKAKQKGENNHALLDFNLLVWIFALTVVTEKSYDSGEEEKELDSRHDEGEFRNAVARHIVILMRITTHFIIVGTMPL